MTGDAVTLSEAKTSRPRSRPEPRGRGRGQIFEAKDKVEAGHGDNANNT